MARQLIPRITLVCGPPCGGKTEYVRQHAADGDLVLDRDQLAIEAGSPNRWMHDIAYTRLAEARMYVELQRLRTTPRTAWVIRGLPNPHERKRVARQYGATIHLCDPGIDECLRRAAADQRPAGTEEAIRRWYERAGAASG